MPHSLLTVYVCGHFPLVGNCTAATWASVCTIFQHYKINILFSLDEAFLGRCSRIFFRSDLLNFMVPHPRKALLFKIYPRLFWDALLESEEKMKFLTVYAYSPSLPENFLPVITVVSMANVL